MRSLERKNLTIREWIVVLGVAGISVFICEFLKLPEKWENATVYSVILFTVVLVALRPAWHRKAFWHNLALVFALHAIALAVVEQRLPPSSQGPHGLPFTVIGIIEGLFIASLLWKRSMRSDGDSHS